MFTQNAVDLMKTRYQHKGETIENVFERVAKAISVKDTRFEKELYRAMIEGEFFPNSPCIRNAGRKKGMLHACLSRDTELLTKTGWKNFDSYIGDEVLTFNEGKKTMEFQRPTDMVSYEQDKMIRFKTEVLDILVTPNHMMLYTYRNKKGEYLSNKIEAQNLLELKIRKAIFTSGDYIFPDDNQDLSLSECELLGWVLTDGCLMKGVVGHKDDGIIIAQLNQTKELVSCLEGSKVKWTKSGYNYRIWSQSARKYRELFTLNKSLKWKVIYSLSKRQMMSLWLGIYYGDAQKRKGTSYAIHQVERERLDQIQTIALLLGKRAHYSTNIRGRTVLNICEERRRTWFVRESCSSTEYNDKVWCVQVPNENLVVRRNGKIAIVGNCFVLPCEDSMTGIFDTVKNMANIFKFGGGVGINFKNLRPKGAPLSSGGTSSGAVSFMGIFDAVTDTVKQGGFRRGALMGINYPSHPEIFDFCRSKLRGALTNFNLSVMVEDSFMKKAISRGSIDLVHEGSIYNTVRASDILDLISLGTWVSGDPALLFFDRINKDNKLYPKVVIDTTNPCSEVGLPHYGACCLGSINISKFVEGENFNFDKFESAVRLASRALLHMNIIGHYPIQQIQQTMKDLNPIGVGIMGFADTLIMLGIRYDSDAALEFIDKLSIPYISGSDSVATESFYKRIIAPTGSLSILGDCSHGIEPVFSEDYERHISIGVLRETKPIYKSDICRTAYQVSPDWHLKIQSRWQQYVDGGISKTVNVPNNTSVDDIKKIYIKAWKMGVKGVTVFRDGSIEGVLKVRAKCDDQSCTL